MFSRVRDGAKAWLGAHHAAEIPYVFGTAGDLLPSTEIDDRLAETIRSYWVQFATTGDPNADGIPDWPQLTLQKDYYMDFGDIIEVRSEFEADICSALSSG